MLANNAQLAGSKFDRADISGGTFSHANLKRASLEKAYLINVDVRGADMTGTNMSIADLLGLKYNKETKFNDATLTGAHNATMLKWSLWFHKFAYKN